MDVTALSHWSIFFLATMAGGVAVPFLAVRFRVRPFILIVAGIIALIVSVNIEWHQGVSLRAPDSASIWAAVATWSLKGFFLGSAIAVVRVIQAREKRAVPASVKADEPASGGRGAEL